MKELRLYLTEWREAKGRSTTELGSMVGVERETIWRWEKGEREPSFAHMMAIADALGVEPLRLFTTPEMISLDTIMAEQPAELRATAARVLRALIGQESQL